ncbi:RHS repeat-associated core domain-containing protein [Lysobacter sp. FW306-1B-D06B]|uniref:RHS repeat domain-containing protein n=1 Tax=Lysobacter sp. FW306-1B-D06B TaxID=3140250 RepID=UPI00313FF638
MSTKYQHNAFGELVRLESPDTGVSAFAYDAAGNRTGILDARGQLSTVAYDGLNRPISVSYSDPILNVTYAYDTVQPDCAASESFSVGRLSRITDSSGETRYCYDRFGNPVRKVQVSNGQTFTLLFSYTKAGRLSTAEYPDGLVVDYVRDGLGRAIEIGITPIGSARQVLLTGARHHPFGPIAGWTFTNGRTMSRTLDLDYRQRTIRSEGSGAGGLDLGFGWDAVGNLVTLQASSFALPPRVSFGYDALHRLTTFKDGPTGTVIESYSYDAAGNRTSFTNAGGAQPYAYPSDSHRLGAIGAAARAYDPAGNITSIGGESREYTYDAAGRMQTVKRDNAVAMQYAYNGLGEQVRRHVEGKSTYFVYDRNGQLLGEYGSTGSPVQQYIWLDGLPIGVMTGGRTYYIEADHLRTPRAVIDPERDRAVWTWDLSSEAFGHSYPSQDPDADGISFTLDLRFPGQRYDAASGVNYNYLRDYEPESGRYIQSDPIGLRGGISTYAYVFGNPLSQVDPAGLARQKDPNGQECMALKQKIENIRKDIDKRRYEHGENPLGLPEKAWPGSKPRESREGHMGLIEDLESRLIELEAKYASECGGGQKKECPVPETSPETRLSPSDVEMTPGSKAAAVGTVVSLALLLLWSTVSP